MTTAKDLLLAAGWKEWDSLISGWFCKQFDDGKHLERFIHEKPDDNLTDMLIRELSESQVEVFEDELCTIVGSAKLMCTYGASLLRATPEQKAQALMETYKEEK